MNDHLYKTIAEKAVKENGFYTLTIMGIDLSLRETGVCVARADDLNTSISLVKTIKTRLSKNLTKAEKFVFDSLNVKSLFSELMLIQKNHAVQITVIELPRFTQSNTAAIATGMLWGGLGFLDYDKLVIVDPSYLKIWSESKRGDKKDKVIKKVNDLIWLTHKYKDNNNVTDAVGLVLAFKESIDNEIKAIKK